MSRRRVCATALLQRWFSYFFSVSSCDRPAIRLDERRDNASTSWNDIWISADSSCNYTNLLRYALPHAPAKITIKNVTPCDERRDCRVSPWVPTFAWISCRTSDIRASAYCAHWRCAHPMRPVMATVLHNADTGRFCPLRCVFSCAALSCADAWMSRRIFRNWLGASRRRCALPSAASSQQSTCTLLHKYGTLAAPVARAPFLCGCPDGSSDRTCGRKSDSQSAIRRTMDKCGMGIYRFWQMWHSKRCFSHAWQFIICARIMQRLANLFLQMSHSNCFGICDCKWAFNSALRTNRFSHKLHLKKQHKRSQWERNKIISVAPTCICLDLSGTASGRWCCTPSNDACSIRISRCCCVRSDCESSPISTIQMGDRTVHSLFACISLLAESQFPIQCFSARCFPPILCRFYFLPWS